MTSDPRAAPVDEPVEPTDPSEEAEEAERRRLEGALDLMQEGFEQRALSAMAEPLIATPLTMQQLKVLAVIALDPERATGRDLAGLLRVSLASMSGIVDRLVEHGMIERVEDRADRRVRRLVVTEAGQATIRSLVSSSGAIPKPVLRRIGLDDLRALVQGIRALDRATAELEAERT